MADSFNPYRDWLGLADGQRPATHYGLFGLKPLESDAAEIRKAIARLAAKVRGVRPGSRKREWQEIIQELSVAKACLTDPAAKASYDAQLRARGSTTGKSRSAAPMAVPPTPPQAKGVAPPAAKGKPGASTQPKPTVKPTKALPPTKDALPPAAGSGVSAPPKPTPRPVWEDEWADEPPPAERPEFPVIFSRTPNAVPGSARPPAAPPQAGDPPPVREWSPSPGGQAPAPGSPQGPQVPPPPVPGAPQGYPAVPPINPAQAGHMRPGAAGYPVDNMSFAPDPEANQIAIPVDIFWDPDEEEIPERTWTVAGLAITFLLSLVVLLVTLGGLLMYDRYAKNLAAARARQSDRAVVAKPPAVLPRPTVSDPRKSASEEFARKKASLQQNLTELVAALARRDMAAAQALVAQARANAQSPDEQRTVDKHAKLSEDVREFLGIIGGRVSKFQPAEEVTLGKTRIIVVEARGGRFSFRYGSKILNYTVETLPTWLVIALADGNLANDGRSKELYGAFLAVDPDGDRARAQSLWSEAAKMGIPIDQLLPAIDSLPSAQSQ